MAKKKVFELANELGVASKDIITFLGTDVKAISSLDEESVGKVQAHFGKGTEEVKAPEKAPAEKPATEEKASDDAPKKKKVFLFRPENAKGSLGDKFKKDQQPAKSQQTEKKPVEKAPEKTQTNKVIKTTVKTTAESYKDLNEGDKVIKKVDDRQVEKKAEVPVEKAQETVEKAATSEVKPETKPVEAEKPAKTKETAPVVTEAPVEKAPEKKAETVTEERHAEAPLEKAPETVWEAPKAPEKTVEKAVETEKKEVEAEKKAEEVEQEQAPKEEKNLTLVHRDEKTVTETVQKPQKPENKPVFQKSQNTETKAPEKKDWKNDSIFKQPKENKAPQKAPEKKVEINLQKPQKTIAVVGRVDLSEVKRQEESAKNPAKKGIFASKSNGKNIHFVDNRNSAPQGQNGQGGQRKPFDKNRPFNKDGFNKNGGFNSNRPDNRGIFSKDGDKDGNQGRQGGTFVRVNRDNQNAGPALTKSDVRGKKNNAKVDKERNSFDRNGNGKKAENFKNLQKDQHNKHAAQAQEEQIKLITLPDVITIKDLADKMKLKAADLIKKLFLKGKMMTLNSELSYEEAEEIAVEYDILCEKEVQVNVIEELLKEDEEDEKLLMERPPVVCVMGHVDHGKTSLLDAIRKTNVTSHEAGGITQHIGAYMVNCNGKKITFLDTPGHEAFTAMRMRGAQATDIAVLVVAADDGVMPQTVEAINHAKAAGVEVIVAVNKIDKPAANIERVKQALSEYELVPEDWGGSTVFVPVSAKTGENIDQLLEMILLVTEVKELKANPNREMRGLVIEAKLDKGRGPVATVLVQKGTMKQGDFVSCGSCYGRVRAMVSADGSAMKAATPSTPVEILGLNGVPNAGEVCIGHKNEKDARSYAETFIAEEKKQKLAETKQKLTMDSLFSQIQAGNIKELPIVIKADVQGSVEAVRNSLEKLSNEEVTVKVIHGGVGAINESDVSLASASNAIIIGFNVKPDQQAKALAESENVDLKLYRVIYQAIDDVEAAMKGMLAPVYEEKILGHAEIRQTFKASGVGMIAGSYILDGTFERGCQARITRDKEVIFDGNVASLKRFKDDVKEVREGFECGIVFEKFNDIQEGDTVEAYKMVQVARE